MNESRKNKIIALTVTAVVALLMLIVLFAGRLGVTLSPDREWPPEKHGEIIFESVPEQKFIEVVADMGDEVVESGHTTDAGQSDTESTEQTQLSYDAENSGSTESNLAPPISSDVESPAEQLTPEKPAGNRQPDIDAEAQAAAKRQQQADKNAEKIANRRWQNSGKGNDGGKQTPENEGINDTKGSGGGTGLSMTASAEVRPRSSKLGQIVVNVTVLPDGRVSPGSAVLRLDECKGEAATDKSLQSRCLTAAYDCRFSRPAGQSSKLTGTIYFKWEDK